MHIGSIKRLEDSSVLAVAENKKNTKIDRPVITLVEQMTETIDSRYLYRTVEKSEESNKRRELMMTS